MTPFKHLIPLIDLTTLNPDETEARIVKFCKNATTPFGRVASVCVAPEFVALTRQTLDQLHAERIGVTTVFWQQDLSEEELLKRIDVALDAGASHIEILYPYQAHKNGDEALCAQYIAGARALCLTKGAQLKVILECAQLEQEASIRRACQIAINHGAHFLKSNSHLCKSSENHDWLHWILDEINRSGKTVGIKLSGSCLDIEQTQKYLCLVQAQQGEAWVDAQHLRIGCSSLLTEILNLLGATAADTDDAF